MAIVIQKTSFPKYSGNHGQDWNKGVASLPEGEYQIIFEAIVGASDTGDVAIDDVVIYNRPCHMIGLDSQEEILAEESEEGSINFNVI